MKKTLIWGYGLSGRSAHELLLKKESQNQVFITDKNLHLKDELKEIFLTEEEAYETYFDEVILSPGVFLKKKVNTSLLHSEIDFSFTHKSPNPFIAITGSNGKTSTRNFLGGFLQYLGYETFIGGNSGEPLSAALVKKKSYDFYVCEISSFSLENIVYLKPNLIIYTNIIDTHKERYPHFEDYKKAKNNIFKNATPETFFITDTIRQSHLHEFLIKDLNLTFNLEQFPGEHQEKNLKMAYLAAKCFISFQDELFFKYLKNLQPFPHRLEYFVHNNLEFYNDSKSTNLFSLETALKAMKKPFDLLIGGLCPHENHASNIKNLLKDYPLMKNFLVFGQLKQFFPSEHHIEITDICPQTLKTSTLLFSPGCQSLDTFKNYEERGLFFKNQIKKNF